MGRVGYGTRGGEDGLERRRDEDGTARRDAERKKVAEIEGSLASSRSRAPMCLSRSRFL